MKSTMAQKPFERKMREWSQDSLENRKKAENKKAMVSNGFKCLLKNIKRMNLKPAYQLINLKHNSNCRFK